MDRFQVLFTTKISKKNSILYKSKDKRLSAVYVGKEAFSSGYPKAILVTVEDAQSYVQNLNEGTVLRN